MNEGLLLLIIHVLFGLITMYLFKRQGRSSSLGFVLGFLLGIFGLIISLLISRDPTSMNGKNSAAGSIMVGAWIGALAGAMNSGIGGAMAAGTVGAVLGGMAWVLIWGGIKVIRR